MTNTVGESAPTTLSPDEAFKILGNETRIKILQALGEADEPMPFSALRNEVGIRQGAQFNYHLDKLVGHFVNKTDDGYALRQSGQRVIEAVLSEAVTDAPIMERTRIDQSCKYCGAPVEIRYQEGHVEKFCTECAGMESNPAVDEGGYLGCLMIPPAGVQTRSADEMFHAAWIWTRLTIIAVANGLCPRCSATLDRQVTACDEHDASDGLCEACERRHAVQVRFDCTNCIYDGAGTLEIGLMNNTALLDFLIAHGLNPLSSERISEITRVLNDTVEVVHSSDPFRAEVTFTANDDTLSLLIDDNLDVIEATTSETPEVA